MTWAWGLFLGVSLVNVSAKSSAQEPNHSLRLPDIRRPLANPDSVLRGYGAALQHARAEGDAWAEAGALAGLAALYHRGLANADFVRALAYYDSAAGARSIGVRAAFRDASDSRSPAINEDEVRFFNEWALAELTSDSSKTPTGKTALASLAIFERGRSHRLLASRSSDQQLMNMVRLYGTNPEEDGQTLLFWTMGLRTVAATIAYLVTDDTLVTWLILPSRDVTVFRRPIKRDSIQTYVSQLRAGAEEQRAVAVQDRPGRESTRRGVGDDLSVEWDAAATRLRELLLPPDLIVRLPSRGEVVVVPDGSLNLVPFAALPTSPDGHTVGERFAVRYSLSLSMLEAVEHGTPLPFVNRGAAVADTGTIRYGWKTIADSMLKLRRAWLAHSLVVGNPKMPTAPDISGKPLKLSPLPGAQEEATSVATILGTPPRVGPKATETMVKSLLSKTNVVHLATHGYAYQSRDHVNDSFVALAPGEGNDGILTVSELLANGEALVADLVVLSACQTGVGNIQEGEGTVGLQYAFLARGARSVLVSLWSVNDKATALLMRQFYHHWLDDIDGPMKSEALRRAQADVRGTAGFEHPRYWAAFQLVGAQ
jgi:CHAT domain-containing protein